MEDFVVNRIALHVQQLFDTCKRPFLLYHNLEHTVAVVDHSKRLAEHYELDNKLKNVLLAAAWFHDTGQLTGDISVHEQTSVQLMKDFLFNETLPGEMITQIEDCILATKMPVAPNNLLEKILCDADTWHLGTKEFQRLDVLVWKELELRSQISIEHQSAKSLQFLKNHRFYTDYSKQLLSEGKSKNIQLLESIQ